MLYLFCHILGSRGNGFTWCGIVRGIPHFRVVYHISAWYTTFLRGVNGTFLCEEVRCEFRMGLCPSMVLTMG